MHNISNLFYFGTTYRQYEVAAYMYFTSTIITFLHIL